MTCETTGCHLVTYLSLKLIVINSLRICTHNLFVICIVIYGFAQRLF